MNEIKEKTKLFANGLPKTFGYATSDIVEYNINDAKTRFMRLKEWDFYQITSPEFCMQLTIGHVSYVTSVSCVVFDFMTGHRIEVSKMLPFKKVEMNSSAEEPSETTFKDKDFELTFRVKSKFRQIVMRAKDKTYGDVHIDLSMLMPVRANILVSTPFEKPDEFYLNEKVNLMPTSGFARFGNLDFNFNTKANFAVLDWGRGVLPFKHEWVWGSGSGLADGKYFGFNVGTFGNNKFGTENVFYYDGKTYKLKNVDIFFDKTNYTGKWKLLSDDGRFDFEMTPFYDNFTKTKLLFVDNRCHQVFGKWNGSITLDDGERIEVREFVAFCEHACNKW